MAGENSTQNLAKTIRENSSIDHVLGFKLLYVTLNFHCARRTKLPYQTNLCEMKQRAYSFAIFLTVNFIIKTLCIKNASFYIVILKGQSLLR